jgi:hypothetical protein
MNQAGVNSTPPGTVKFENSASAGNQISFTNHGGHLQGGVVEFHQNSTAANGTFTNFAATERDGGVGSVMFFDTSTAGDVRSPTMARP